MKYDPLALKISPHITLIFPFIDEMDDPALIQHVRVALDGQSGFSVGFSDPVSAGAGRVWLPVRGEPGLISEIHAKLYTGCMRKHLKPELPYVPHVTLGVVPAARLSEATAEARSLRLEPEYPVDVFILERIGDDEGSHTSAVIKLLPPQTS